MSQLPAVLVGAVAGALVAFVAMSSFQGGDADPPPAIDVPAKSTPTIAPTSVTTVDLQPVLDRLDALAKQVARLETARAVPTASERVPVTTEVPAPVDVDALANAIEEVERRKLDELTDKELLRKANQISQKGGPIQDSIRHIEAALRKDLTPERRGEVATQLGRYQRALGTPEGLAASERTLSAIVNEHGIGSEVGATAAYQMAWTASYQKNPDRGLEIIGRYLQSPAITDGNRISGRWAQALMHQQLGNRAEAIAQLQQLLRECQGVPAREKLAEDIQRRLDNF